MNKTELTKKVHAELEKGKYDYTKTDVQRIIDKTFEIIKATVVAQKPVKISGLVSFKRKRIQAKTYKVPGTKRTVKKQDRDVTRAYISKTLAEQSEKTVKKK